MSEPYTPDTEDVRTRYFSGSGRILPAYGEFDRWLASVKAEAWDEGVAAHYKFLNSRSILENPHRTAPNA